jgi:hypothetical protein
VFTNGISEIKHGVRQRPAYAYECTAPVAQLVLLRGTVQLLAPRTVEKAFYGVPVLLSAVLGQAVKLAERDLRREWNGARPPPSAS